VECKFEIIGEAVKRLARWRSKPLDRPGQKARPDPVFPQSNAQRQRVAEAFEELSKLRRGVSLDIPLRQAIEHGRD
jgi:hypothetical protein